MTPAQEKSTNPRLLSWDFDKVDWNVYESHRPPYTKAMYDIIFQHHQAHSGQWEQALDVGGGGGIVSSVLLTKFKHVVCSDASPVYVAQVKERFCKEAAEGRASTLQRKFDQFSPEDFPHGPVNMLTMGTCIHFSQPQEIMTLLAPLVRQGGTIAAFTYGFTPCLPPEHRLRPYVEQITETLFKWFHHTVVDLTNHSSAGTFVARYNNIAFDTTLWTHVRRIDSLDGAYIYPEFVGAQPSQVREGELRELVDDNIISLEVDYDFFVGLYTNLAPGIDVSDVLKDPLEKLRGVLGNEKVFVKFPLIMVVATRR